MSDHLTPIPWLDVLLIFALIGLNGVLSMSELAIVSSREARLKAMAKSGSGGAQCALDLASEPGRFLSTVQTGITLISIINGAFSGTALGEPAAARFELAAGPDDVRQALLETPHTRIPVADGSVENIIGVIQVRDVLAAELAGRPLELKQLCRKAPVIPDLMDAMDALTVLRSADVPLA